MKKQYLRTSPAFYTHCLQPTLGLIKRLLKVWVRALSLRIDNMEAQLPVLLNVRKIPPRQTVPQ